MKQTDEPIIVEQFLDTSIDNVWSAITELDRMKLWFFDNIPAFEPKVGFETQFIVQTEDRVFPHLWKLTEVEPPNKISYDWKYEGYPGRCTVIFDLTKKGTQTNLKLTATVNEDFPNDIPEFERKSCIGGWNYFIKQSLRDYLKE